MAYDLLFNKQTSRNLARKPTVKVRSTESLVLTEPEKAMLARIAHCRAKAQAGDKQARSDWGKTVKQIVATRRQAARGNVKAQRAVAVLVQSGMFPSKKKLASKATPGALKPLISGNVGQYYAPPLPLDVANPGLLLAWPIIALIEFFEKRSSSKAEDRAAREMAVKAVDEAMAKGITSGPKFDNAVWLTFGFKTSQGYKYGNQGTGVPEVRKNVVKKVWAHDPKAVAFYKAALRAGYNPPKGDPSLVHMS